MICGNFFIVPLKTWLPMDDKETPSSLVPSFINSSTFKAFIPISIAFWCFGKRFCSLISCEWIFSILAADSVVVACLFSIGDGFCWSVFSSTFGASGTDSGITWIKITFATNWEEAKLVSSLNAQLTWTVARVVFFTSSSRSDLMWVLFSIILSAKDSKAENS